MDLKSKAYEGVKGQITENAPLGAHSWFGCGGSADLLFKPADEDDLQNFLKSLTTNHQPPITIIGGLANTIIRDGGLRGATIQLGKEFAGIELMGDNYIHAGCGSLNGNIAAAAVKAGIGGLEFLSGIPGTLGGALRMNAGAYGSEIKDILVEIHALDFAGNRYILLPSSSRGSTTGSMDAAIKSRHDAEEMTINLSYRNNDAPHYLIFTSAILKGVKEDYETVKARMNEIKTKRNETQPIKEKTGGSTFANPSAEELRLAGLPEGTRAWQVVEKVEGRGLSIGGAQMSEKHCNFMINTGSATAADLENLGDEIRARALHDLGLDLHWEIKRIGEKA